MNRRAFLLATALLLLLVSPAGAVSVVSEITPRNLQAHGLVFEVKAEPAADGKVQFRIVIRNEGGEYRKTLETDLGVYHRTPGSTEIKPVRHLALERKERTVVSVFTVERKELKDSDLCFVFRHHSDSVVGTYIDFYCVRLSEFAAAAEKEQAGAAR